MRKRFPSHAPIEPGLVHARKVPDLADAEPIGRHGSIARTALNGANSFETEKTLQFAFWRDPTPEHSLPYAQRQGRLPPAPRESLAVVPQRLRMILADTRGRMPSSLKLARHWGPGFGVSPRPACP